MNQVNITALGTDRLGKPSSKFTTNLQCGPHFKILGVQFVVPERRLWCHIRCMLGRGQKVFF